MMEPTSELRCRADHVVHFITVQQVVARLPTPVDGKQLATVPE